MTRSPGVAALAATALAAVPSAASAASYGGSTRVDGNPIVFSVKAGRVDRVVLMFTARCRSGESYSFGSRLTRGGGRVPMRVTMQGGGRFRATSAAAEQLTEGRVAGTGIVVKGRIRGRRITGGITATTVIGREGAEPEERCSYRRTFAAVNAPGRILTGETSQRLPLVMQLDRRARNVRVLHIGWSAGCEPPGFFQIGDELLRFRIRNGAFGDDFEHTVPLEGEGERVFRYQLHGRANRRRASGTIAVELEDRGGPAPGVCRTQTVRWRAS
jgi:hypothetical protein